MPRLFTVNTHVAVRRNVSLKTALVTELGTGIATGEESGALSREVPGCPATIANLP